MIKSLKNRKMIYIQKFIKTEDDLPKEEGEYLCHHKSTETSDEFAYEYSSESEYIRFHWILTIDWYFLPVELPTDVEILLQSSDNKIYVNDDQRIGYQKGMKSLRDKLMGK
jgi:hypothetical protein